MPDHIGAFLKASERLSSLGINITRVSYNKAIDTHTLFIDVEGSSSDVKKADQALSEIGYLQNINVVRTDRKVQNPCSLGRTKFKRTFDANRLLASGNWHLFGAHGNLKNFVVNVD